MSNNIDFKLKNAVEVGGPTKVTLGTVTSNDIDLSTGNYFADTPTGASTYTISNAPQGDGDVQSFQLEVTGGTDEVAQNFSTTLYTGNAGTQTITNGIDLSGDGGLVWTKDRDTAVYHALVDTERGGQNMLVSSETLAQTDRGSDFITSFKSDGYSIGADGLLNDTYNYVSWTFKKQAKFFDVVTYTGNGVAGREIPHNLGSVPACIIVKNTALATNWIVYHSGADSTSPEDYYFYLDSTNARIPDATMWDSTAPTSTTFTVGSDNAVNRATDQNTYVAYLFAHDDAADGLIQCGSYTGTSSSIDISLGWEPQWLLIKRSDSVEDWSIVDNVRGMGTDPLLTGLKALTPNTSSAEESPAYSPIVPSSTGFTAHTGYDARYAANGGTYIYVAIRAASDLDLTWPSSIEWAGGSAPSAPATGETDVFTFVTDDGGTSYVGLKTADNLS